MRYKKGYYNMENLDTRKCKLFFLKSSKNGHLFAEFSVFSLKSGDRWALSGPSRSDFALGLLWHSQQINNQPGNFCNYFSELGRSGSARFK